jgi:hypothetical protein
VLDERAAFIVLVDSAEESLVLMVSPVTGELRLDHAHGAFTVTIWREDPDTVRMSLRSGETGSVAYVQGGSTLIALAAELGLVARA